MPTQNQNPLWKSKRHINRIKNQKKNKRGKKCGTTSQVERTHHPSPCPHPHCSMNGFHQILKKTNKKDKKKMNDRERNKWWKFIGKCREQLSNSYRRNWVRSKTKRTDSIIFSTRLLRVDYLSILFLFDSLVRALLCWHCFHSSRKPNGYIIYKPQRLRSLRRKQRLWRETTVAKRLDSERHREEKLLK